MTSKVVLTKVSAQREITMNFSFNLRIGYGMVMLLLVFFCVELYAEEIPIKLEKAIINTHDIASIKRGAKTYATYCLVCHAMDFMEHDPIAKAAGIIPSKMPDKDKNWWYGTAPPSLTLETKIRGIDWVYTYLLVFYKDPSRPTGSNNLLIDNVNMPNPFIGLQGEQRLIVNKQQLFEEDPAFTRKIPYYSVLELANNGSMPPDQFDTMLKDLVNFLNYASEPKRYSRETIGFWVLIFLGLFFIIVYLLNREVWKKIKK